MSFFLLRGCAMMRRRSTRFLVLVLVSFSLAFLCFQLTLGRNNPGFDLSSTATYHPRITIFTYTRRVFWPPDPAQIRIINAWRALYPSPKIVVMGLRPNDSILCELVTCEPLVERNMIGSPLLRSILLRAHRENTDIAMVLDPNMALRREVFHTVLNTVRLRLAGWLLVAAPREIRANPNSDVESTSWDGVSAHVGLWAWDKVSAPLLDGHVPGLTMSSSAAGEWLLREALRNGSRAIVDITHSRAVFRVIAEDVEMLDWEAFMDAYLAHCYRPTCDPTQMTALWRVAECTHGMCWNRTRRLLHNCEPPLDLTLANGGNVRCQVPSDDSIPTSLPPNFRVDPYFGLPIRTMRPLLLKVAQNRAVVLSFASFEHRHRLMQFYCRLQALEIRNFVLAAMDYPLYRFAHAHGLPVFFDEESARITDNEVRDCDIFGGACLRSRAKVRSRAVVIALTEGYDVLVSDLDVVWMRNPLPLLQDTPPGVIAIQSNERAPSKPANGVGQMNSGFYFVRSANETIAAMDVISHRVRVSQIGEQPYFYDVLCGRRGQLREGDDACWNAELGVRTVFLDRDAYPNGGYSNIWESKDIAKEHPKTVVLHNNWLEGPESKLTRLQRHQLDVWDPAAQICRYTWRT